MSTAYEYIMQPKNSAERIGRTRIVIKDTLAINILSESCQSVGGAS
jgi:hypothetical protein